ncbi:MAG TPA: hypothetical protein VJT72_01070 [Pseudonocardiaceae bacterium]|nr:hypothetical protein [Pseudonocardiaceae bacterium]
MVNEIRFRKSTDWEEIAMKKIHAIPGIVTSVTAALAIAGFGGSPSFSHPATSTQPAMSSTATPIGTTAIQFASCTTAKSEQPECTYTVTRTVCIDGGGQVVDRENGRQECVGGMYDGAEVL